MFEQYINQLRVLLRQLGYTDIENVLLEITAKHDRLIESGESEEDFLASLGDVEKLACSISGKKLKKEVDKSKEEDEGPKSMAGVYINDILIYGLGMVLSICGGIAVAFLSGLSGYIGCLYCYKSWTDPIFSTVSAQTLAFILSICAVVMCALGIWLTVVIIEKLIAGSKKYFAERKQSVMKIKGVRNDKTTN